MDEILFIWPTTVDDYTKQNNMIIRRKFGNLLLKVLTTLQKKLKKSQIKSTLRTFILGLFPDISPDLIPNTSDLKEIFEAASRNHLWSFINYFPLEQIVVQFGDNDPEITSEIEKFKKDRAGFMLATKIKEYITIANARLCEDEVQLNPINLNRRVAEHSLTYLEELWQSLSFQMQLPPISLFFQVALEGGCSFEAAQQYPFLVKFRWLKAVFGKNVTNYYFSLLLPILPILIIAEFTNLGNCHFWFSPNFATIGMF